MNNEKYRIQALRKMLLEALDDSERLMAPGDLVAYAGATGRLQGTIKVAVTDARYWLEEMAHDEQMRTLPSLEQVLDPRD